MTLYHDDKAAEAIKALPKEAKDHLSHVVRNWVAVTGACRALNVSEEERQEEMKRFEAAFRALGL